MASTYSTSNSTSTTKRNSQTTGGSKSTTSATGAVSQKTQENRDKYSNPYQQSQKVTDAYNKLQNQLNNAPGQFSSTYQAQLDDLYNRIANREKFEYDVNNDMLYDQLKNQYAALGKLAMQDTMGQAASMTGGYGNSYAQTAGQQTYQNYMQQLNEQLPELYNMAQQRYNQEGENLYNLYGLAQQRYDTDYNQYRDTVGDYFTNRDYLTGVYQDARDWDYNQFANERGYWNDEYWNERNAQTTTEGSDWSNTTDVSTTTSSSTSSSTSSDGGSGSGGSSSESSAKASLDGLSSDDLEGLQAELEALNTTSQKKRLVDAWYSNGEISEENWNWFYDKYGFDRLTGEKITNSRTSSGGGTARAMRV